jgi:hypothetical protein
LLAAEHIFDLADTSPSGNLLTTAPFDFYPENEWRDDLELGATELYLALRRCDQPQGLPHKDPVYYLKLAAHWAHAYITGPNDQTDTLNLLRRQRAGALRALPRHHARRKSRGLSRHAEGSRERHRQSDDDGDQPVA